MKKILLILTVFAMLIISTSAKNSFPVKIKKKNYNVNSCNVKIDGKDLQTTYNAYVKDGRTFVPIREITEALGADVLWDNEKKTALISMNDKNIKLQIGSSIVFVNDEKTKIDKNSVPALVDYIDAKGTKTMVPLRFLSETFGYDVSWDQDKFLAQVNSYKTDSIMDKDEKKLVDKKDNTTNKNDKKTKIKKKDNKKNKTKKTKTKNPEKNSLNNINSIVKNQYQSKEEIKETKYLTEKIFEDESESALKAVGLDSEDMEKKQVVNENLYVNGKVRIILDPGHGGKDSGANSKDNKVHEKDLTLLVATKLYNRLLEDGMDVSITRTRDEFIKLQDRASLANETNADIFLSIHINSSENTNASGIEVLYASEKNIKIKSTVQKYFAQELQKALLKETGAVNRGIKNRPAIIVLNQTKTVAALAELGFISNDEELSNLTDDDYIDKLVNGLYNGIYSYIDKYVKY